MKKLIFILFVFLSVIVKSQTNCQNAQPFCAGGVSGVTFPASTGGTGAQSGPNYGCLGTQPNPAWYYLQIGASGSLDILIQGVATSPPGPGQDVDFICWGPFSSLAGICNSLTAANTIDCSYSSSYTETLNITSGISGEYYLVLITNFANVSQNILFTQFGGTGNTNCALLSSNTSICSGKSATLTTTAPQGLTNITYSILPGGNTSTTPSFVVSPTLTTSYTIYASGTSSANVILTQTASANVTVNPQPLVAPTTTNTTCTTTNSAFNLGLTFTPGISSPGYTVTWSTIPNGVNSITQTTANGFISPGVYNASITTVNGCSTVAQFTINPKPEPASYTLSPNSNNYVLNCYTPSITINAANAANNYTWVCSNNNLLPNTNSVITVTNNGVGTWTIYALNPNSGCTAKSTFAVTQNTNTPTSAVTPSFQNITCSLSSISNVTLTASPSVNVQQIVLSPSGGTYSVTLTPLSYLPGGPGTYTYCVTNTDNGCSTIKNFTVQANQGYPTFSVQSPQNFTLGCGTKSTAIINIVGASATTVNQVPIAGPVSYTILPPGASSVTPLGVLSSSSTATVSVPGAYTVITKDNTSYCETRVAISVLSNTAGPILDSVIVPQTVLDCNTPSVVLQAFSQTPNTIYTWANSASPGIYPSSTVVVTTNTASPSTLLIANYSLTLTDNNNKCVTNTVVAMNQNVFPPNAIITNGGISSITCKTPTLLLTNSSTSGVPGNVPYPKGLVQGYIWDGPSPQVRNQISTTYVAATIGSYSMIAKDISNGCTSQTVITITDGRIYPAVNTPSAPAPFVLDCGASVVSVSANISGTKSDLVYSWQLPSISGVTSLSTEAIGVTTLGVYKVLVTNTLNGCSAIGAVTVVPGNLNPNVEASSYSGFAPLTVSFNNLSASTTGTGNVSTYWDFGNKTYSNTAAGISPQVSYNSPGTYTVVAYVNKGLCIDKVIKVITVEMPSELEIPNVFTPNDDGVNDIFFLRTSSLQKISAVIYDRWGHKVYEINSDTGNIAWDGKNQFGVKVPEGVYLYIIKAEGADGANYDKKGNITLMR